MRRWVLVLLGLFFLAWGLAEAGVGGVQVDLLDWLSRLWPLLLVYWGGQSLVRYFREPGAHDVVLGTVVFVLGVVLLLNNFQVLSLSLWAALLLGLGVGFLLKAWK